MHDAAYGHRCSADVGGMHLLLENKIGQMAVAERRIGMTAAQRQLLVLLGAWAGKLMPINICRQAEALANQVERESKGGDASDTPNAHGPAYTSAQQSGRAVMMPGDSQVTEAPGAAAKRRVPCESSDPAATHDTEQGGWYKYVASVPGECTHTYRFAHNCPDCEKAVRKIEGEEAPGASDKFDEMAHKLIMELSVQIAGQTQQVRLAAALRSVAEQRTRECAEVANANDFDGDMVLRHFGLGPRL